MAEKVPIRAVYNGADTCGLSELRCGEVVGVEHGGIGVCSLSLSGAVFGSLSGSVWSPGPLTTNGQVIIGGISGPANANITGTTNEVEITNADKSITIGLPATVSGLTCVGATCLGGTLQTAAQANVTSLGNLSSLCIVGDTVVGGDLTIAGDDLTMTTNTSGALLIADGTNYNPAVMSGDSSISSAGVVTLASTNTNLTTLANVTTIGTIGSGVWQGTAVATEYIASTLTGKTLTTATLTSPVLNGTLSGTAFLDEDDMASDSAAAAASQQSIKAYVDAVASGLDMKDSSHAATTACLTSTYNNGSSGVGATLTNAGAQAALSVDGQTMVATERVLIKDQTAACHNGIYTVTTVGDGLTNWVITRATDFDSSTEVTSGAFTFVETGTTNGDNGFVMTADGTITIGTTAINWSQFSGAGQITAGSGMTKSGNTLNVIAGANITANADDVALSTTITGLSALTSTNLTGTLQTAAQANVTSVGTLTSLNSSGNVSFDGGTFIFNETGADKDFRIEGDTAANLFITDASVDRIGIGTATPSHLLDIEGVGHASTCFVSADLCATTKVVAAAICMGGGYALPTSDGTAGYILCTDGSGAVSFAAAASSGHTISEDGSILADRTCLNFCGTAVTVTDCSLTNSTDVKVDATGACMPIRVSAGTQCYACLATATIAAPCLQCDSAPKLGGSLDVNGNSIISAVASNGNIPITPNGSGIVIIDGICHPVADGSAGQLLCTDGSAALKFATASAGVTLAGSTNNTIATVTGANALIGEANLTFDGTTLAVTGAADVSGDFTAGTVNADGDTAASDNAAMGYTVAEGLILTGQGSTSDVTIKNDADATVLSIPTGTTNVGIGTTAPTAHLNVEGPTGTGTLHISRNGTAGSFAAANYHLARLGFGGQDSDSGEDNEAASIDTFTSQAWTSSAHGTYMKFSTTADGATASTERMRIDSSGYVGIANSVPGSYTNLSSAMVIGDTADNNSELVLGAKTTGNGRISFTDTVSTTPEGRILYDHNGPDTFFFQTAATNVMYLDSTGMLGVGDRYNTDMTQGITINQGTADNEILALKSSDIAHGMTTVTETDTYGWFNKLSGTQGGLGIWSITENSLNAAILYAFTDGANSTKSAAGGAAAVIRVGKKSGTGSTSYGVDENMAGFYNQASGMQWIIDGSGDVYYGGGTNANHWDDEDDIGLLSTFRNLTTGKRAQHVFGEFIQENAQVLHDSGVITLNDDGNHFVSTKGLNALIIDTIRQEGQKWRKVAGEYQDKIAALESRLMRLEN